MFVLLCRLRPHEPLRQPTIFIRSYVPYYVSLKYYCQKQHELKMCQVFVNKSGEQIQFCLHKTVLVCVCVLCTHVNSIILATRIIITLTCALYIFHRCKYLNCQVCSHGLICNCAPHHTNMPDNVMLKFTKYVGL